MLLPIAMDTRVRKVLQKGAVIPAHRLALNAQRKLDERRQRAVTRYYCEAGAGGISVGVHTTQFAIRDPRVGLLEPVLKLAIETVRDYEAALAKRLMRIAGVCGGTAQALRKRRRFSSVALPVRLRNRGRSEEHTSELQSRQ